MHAPAVTSISIEAVRARIILLAQTASVEIVRPINSTEIMEALGSERLLFVPSIPEKNPARPPIDPLETTIAQAVALQARGYQAVPHIAVRNYRDQAHLEEALRRLQEGNVTRVLLIAGDNERPGAFKDTLAVLTHDAFKDIPSRYGITNIAFAGHPNGDSKAPDQAVTARALTTKIAFARMTKIPAEFITQLCFRPSDVVLWAGRVKADHDDGVSVTAGIFGPLKSPGKIFKSARLSGFSWQQILRGAPGMAAAYMNGILRNRVPVPDQQILEYAQHPDKIDRLHIFAFGQVGATVKMLGALKEGKFELTKTRRGLRLRIDGFVRRYQMMGGCKY